MASAATELYNAILHALTGFVHGGVIQICKLKANGRMQDRCLQELPQAVVEASPSGRQQSQSDHVGCQAARPAVCLLIERTTQCRCISADNAQTASAAAVEALQPDASPKVTRAALGILAALKRQGLSGSDAALSSQQLSQVSLSSTWSTYIPAYPIKTSESRVQG